MVQQTGQLTVTIWTMEAQGAGKPQVGRLPSVQDRPLADHLGTAVAQLPHAVARLPHAAASAQARRRRPAPAVLAQLPRSSPRLRPVTVQLRPAVASATVSASRSVFAGPPRVASAAS